MDRRSFQVIAVVILTASLGTGCGIMTGRRSFSDRTGQAAPETRSAGAEIGTSSGGIAAAQVDPCTLNIDNPVWRDHGGRPAYENRCGHPPPS
jgi:hypothetical protein